MSHYYSLFSADILQFYLLIYLFKARDIDLWFTGASACPPNSWLKASVISSKAGKLLFVSFMSVMTSE